MMFPLILSIAGVVVVVFTVNGAIPVSAACSDPLIPKKLAKMIDHTFLKPSGGPEDVEKLCQEARQFDFAIVCVNPSEVERSVKLLKGTHVHVGTVVGFPLGQSTTSTKVYETQDAIQRGAREIDMVLNVRELRRGNYDYVKNEIEQVVSVCHKENQKGGIGCVLCKVILETCYLNEEQIIHACQICREAGVDFVKTSTGFGSGGATVDHVRLMRETVGPDVGVKASGGIRTLADANKMVAAGASRIGTSNGVTIIEELKQSSI